MRRLLSRLVSGAAVAGLALGCGSAEPGAAPGAGEAVAAEQAAPDFELPDLNGVPVRLSSFRGKTVVLDFWATWCPPCVFQVPELNKLAAAHAGSGDLAVIGVAVDVEGADTVGPWVEEQDVGYTIVLGDEQLARSFGAVGFPTLALIRADGSIASLHVGLVEHDELEELVASVQ